MRDFLAALPQHGFGSRWAILVGSTLAVFLPVLPVAWWMSGTTGVAAAAVAAAACLAGASVALVVSSLLLGTKLFLFSLLMGMVARMGLPLVLAVVVFFRQGALAQSGFLYYLLLFYPVTLAVETCLSLAGQPVANEPQPPRTGGGLVRDSR